MRTSQKVKQWCCQPSKHRCNLYNRSRNIYVISILYDS